MQKRKVFSRQENLPSLAEFMKTGRIVFKLIALVICIMTLHLEVLIHKAGFVVYRQSEKTWKLFSVVF